MRKASTCSALLEHPPLQGSEVAVCNLAQSQDVSVDVIVDLQVTHINIRPHDADCKTSVLHLGVKVAVTRKHACNVQSRNAMPASH